MTGAHKTPEMLKVNPWHQMPNMTDGDVNIGESGAIIRYIANKYGPDKYGGTDPAMKATIDWALEWMSTNFGKNSFGKIWYPVTGFGPAPEDQAAENQKAKEDLELFVKTFLVGPGKRSDELNPSPCALTAAPSEYPLSARALSPGQASSLAAPRRLRSPTTSSPSSCIASASRRSNPRCRTTASPFRTAHRPACASQFPQRAPPSPRLPSPLRRTYSCLHDHPPSPISSHHLPRSPYISPQAGFELPARCKIYVQDFLDACPSKVSALSALECH